MKQMLRKAPYILLAMIMVVMAPASVYAAKDVHNYIPPAGNIGSVQDLLRDEAHAQLAMYVLSACIGGGINRNENWTNVQKTSTWFDRVADDLTINTGYWYEKQMQGKYDDGRIKCSDTGGIDPITIAANLIGVTKKDILCDGSSAGVAINKDGYACGSSDGEYTRNGNNGGDGATPIDRGSDGMFNNQAWAKHLQKLYDKKAEEAKWEWRFKDVSYYHEMVGYYLYRTEIEAKCGGAETLSSKPSDMDMVLIDVTQNGDQAGKVVYKKYKQNSSFTHEFVDNSYVGSCKTMIARADDDDMYGSYRNRLLATLNYKCKEDIDRRKEMVESSGNELNEETVAAYDAAVADTSNYNIGQFIKGDEANGWQCADIGDFQGATQEDPTGDDLEGDVELSCYTKAGSLGWILCPIIDSLGTFILEKYEQWIVPALQMDVALFSDNADNGTFRAWQVFRDIANVLFVVLFLFVIFSQLTGVGIDNYGIKKILPKLIVGAILINLSYIICQLSIDVFNIMGRGIGSLFKGISDQLGTINSLQVDNVTAPSSAWESFTTSTWSNVLIIIVGALGVAAVLSQGLAIIVPVLLLFISIAFSIFTLIAILGIRQAAAVLLVAVSPLAFACYMLPNTKSIFDKWFNFFKGLLMAFPVCSALIYGGDMAGKILLTAAGQNTWVIISAAVVSVAPIFFIPKVITGSLGAISGAIARFGGGLGRRAQGGLARSGFAMDMNRRAQMQKAGIKFDKNGNAKYTARGRLQNLTHRTTGSKQRLDMARKQAALGQAQMGGAGLMMGAGGLQRMSNMQKAALAGQAEQDVKDIEASIGMTDEINSNEALGKGLYDAMMSGDTNRMKAYQNILYGKGEDGRDAARKAVADAQAQGVDRKMIQDFGANAMNKWAKDLKSNARSDFEFAKAAASGATDKAIGSYRAIDKANKYTAESMATMDDSQVKSMISDINSGAATAEQKAFAQQAAYEALHNDNISLKGERRADLERIAAGYNPSSDATSGGSGDAPSGDAPAGGAPTGGSETPPAEPAPADDGYIPVSGDQQASFKDSIGKQMAARAVPRREGESTQEWAARIKKETGAEIGHDQQSFKTSIGKQMAARATPRKEGESTQEWANRIYRETGAKIGSNTTKD